MKALCFGSLNMDYVYQVPHFVERGETLASSSMEVFSGGKGLNQSVALAKAGMETYLAGAIGEDGRFLLRVLQDAGVDTRYVECREDLRTGHAIIQRNPNGENCILLYGGANRSIGEEQAAQVLAGFAEGDLLLVQNEISALPEIMKLAREKGMWIALNPSPMEPSLLCLGPDAFDLLILNEIEAAQLLGTQCGEPERMAYMLRERYPACRIVLTLGENGSLYLDGSQTLRQRAYRVRAVDTTAAGDTYTGYFLAGLFRSGDAEWALRFASGASAIAVTRPGAAPSIPNAEEVLAFLEEHAHEGGEDR